MDEKKLQEAFILWLAEKLGAVAEDGSVDQNALKKAVSELGEEGLKQAQQQFMQEMQQQKAQYAKFGAKLQYINKLRGI